MIAKQQSSRAVSDLDSCNEELWGSRTNKTEHICVLASSSINPSKEDIEFNKNDLMMYKKQAKKCFKNKY